MIASTRPRDLESHAAKPPRLILRFALYTAIVLAAAASAILLFVRHNGNAQAESAVRFHARFLAQSILRDRLRPSDFSAPVSGSRRLALDRLFRRQVLVGGTLRVRLFGSDGTATYSTDHSPIGPGDQRGLAAALAGGTETHLGSIGVDGTATRAKVLEVFTPVRLGGQTAGALELDQDYVPIARSARKAFLLVAGVLELVLLTLYLSLFPILRRVTQRLRRQVQAIEHQAFHDGLTGLPNRALFRDRLGQSVAAARRNGTGAAVLLLDLDRFKEINDTLGHQSGDLILCGVADRLSDLLREHDTVARLGGDEFSILSAETDASTALVLAERVRDAMRAPFVVDGLQLEVETSIGIALFPDHGGDVDTLIRHADVAMYLSKETHRPTLYSAAEDDHSTERLTLVGELRRAIQERELLVYYQPRVNVETREVRSVEALVRWRHPQRGLLLPSDFVPMAQHTDLVRPLTRYVLDAALAQCRRFRDEGIEIGVAVNLFGRDLLDLALPDEVEALLAKYGIAASQLELEITENTILTDPMRARTILTQLSNRGVRLAIDDFGSGYSSLNYLKRLPVDVLKIDKSFVLGMDTDESEAVIVRSTIELGHNLGLEVVAEGVESAETLEHLAALGCDTVQGYYLGRPQTGHALRRWLAARYAAAKAHNHAENVLAAVEA